MRPRVHRSSARPNFTVLDLFAGCGGLTEGLASVRNKDARFVPVAAVELDPEAAATYAVNFGAHVFQGDIADWIGLGVPEVDIVVGGPPCQGFSTLGKQDPDDHRNKLWIRYAEAVAQARPLYFVLENVVPFIRSAQYQDLELQTEPGGMLEDYEFDAKPLIVRASDFGAAQDRRRAVVVGRRRDMPPIRLSTWPGAAPTTWDAIGDLPFFVHNTDLPDRRRSVPMANHTLEVPGIFLTSELHVTRNFSAVSLRRFRAIPPGGNRHDLPWDLRAPCWKRHTTGSNDVMGRLDWDRPSVTIRTEFWKPEKGRYLHPLADRSITHQEAARLQGFPDDFRWCGTKTSIGRQIGNAVPVPLGRAIGEALLDGLASAGARPKGHP